MVKADNHSRILAKAASELFKPLGVYQKGRSRSWIDDQGWWIGHVEFQPSSWSKGTYLNVGVMWLWYEKDYFSFDVGNRVAQFVSYTDDEQFAKEASRLVQLASEKILEYRKMFREVGDAKKYLIEHANTANLWNSLYAAIVCGCAGDANRARGFFEHLQQCKAEYQWQEALKERAEYLVGLVDDHDIFKAHIEKTILRARQLLKLPLREFVSLT
jgi:hypothetical protein